MDILEILLSYVLAKTFNSSLFQCQNDILLFFQCLWICSPTPPNYSNFPPSPTVFLILEKSFLLSWMHNSLSLPWLFLSAPLIPQSFPLSYQFILILFFLLNFSTYNVYNETPRFFPIPITSQKKKNIYIYIEKAKQASLKPNFFLLCWWA